MSSFIQRHSTHFLSDAECKYVAELIVRSFLNNTYAVDEIFDKEYGSEFLGENIEEKLSELIAHALSEYDLGGVE